MNKEHFLSELSRRLDGLNGNDLYRTLEYYAEMIDDRVEDGMSEEAAVAALGDLEAIAREIMQDAPARESAKREESDEADEPERQVFTGELRRIRLDSRDADFVVRGEELPEGTCCVVENAQDMLGHAVPRGFSAQKCGPSRFFRLPQTRTAISLSPAFSIPAISVGRRPSALSSASAPLTMAETAVAGTSLASSSAASGALSSRAA